MFWRFFLLFISSWIWANTTVLVDVPFTLENNSSTLDTDVRYTHKELLTCSSKMDVVYKIETLHTVKVIPRTPLRSGTDYNCSYKGKDFSFTTEPFMVKDYHYFSQDKLLRLVFNDTIDPKELKNYLTLTKKERLATTKLDYSITQSSDRIVLIKIDEPIHNSAVELSIEQSFTNVNNTSLQESFSASFNDKTVSTIKLDKNKELMEIIDKPQIVALESGEFALRLFFDDTLENDPKEFIEIEGIESFRVDQDSYIDYKLREKLKLSDNVYYYTDIISPEFKPNSTYNVTLKKGLQNYRELKEDKHYTLKSGDCAKSIIFDDERPYISTVGELGFSSVNIDTATVVVERVLEENLRYFINFDRADKRKINSYTQEISSRELTLDNPKNKIVKQKFLLSDLAKPLPYGIYRITLRYSDGKNEKEASRTLFLSNLGISANISKQQAFVTVLALDSAKSVAGATVEIYGANNALLASAKTDSSGVAIISQENLLKQNPKGIIVKTSSDKNFLSLNQPIHSPQPDTILKNPEQFQAHIYLQSKIIRPASEINALVTIKDKRFVSANKLPIKITLQEIYGKVLQEKIYHTDSYGVIDFSYQLDQEDKTGVYYLSASIGDTEIGSSRLKVEAFVPPKIENSIKLSKEQYYTGELIEANISSSYLFGTPASGLNGKITLDSRAIDFTHPNYKDYSFTNHNIAKQNRKTYLEYREDIKLNNQGKLNIALPTNIQQRVPSILEVMIGATIMDDAQPVSTYKKLPLYPYRAMVGMKLKSKQLEKGQKLTGEVVLIDPVSGDLLDRKLYAVIKKIEWHYSYSDGHHNWEEEQQIVDSFSIQSNNPFGKEMRENGEYIIEIYDRLGGHSASSNFSVWWQSYSTLSPKDDLKSVEINFEDKLYKKGDTVSATLKSPILEGELLVTLESDKVESYKLVKLKKGVAKVDINITSETKQGLYLHATAYRASDTSSKLIPFRAMGYRFIKPDNTAHQIAVKIEAPKESKSKTTLKLNISTDKPSKLLISVVDKGILQLTNQKKPKIFEFFNKQADKKISYYDLYDQLISYIAEGNLIAFGAGDDSISKKTKHLAPDLAKRVKPFMIWSGVIDTKDNNTTIGLDIPEFNGQATIVAIAINQDSIGVAEQDIIIKDDIMIKPAYPLYTLAGDRVEIPVRIFNTTKEAKSIELNSTISSNLSLILESKEKLTIAPNSSKLIYASLHAKEVGKGEITLKATWGNESISNSVELPIYNPYAISTKTFKGISNQAETLLIPIEYNNAKAFVTISNNLIGALRDDLKYTVGYPYGCAEQTSSAISAMYYAKPFLKNDSLVSKSQHFIRQGIKKLRNMQNYYGEFSYWEEDGEINAYASLYTAQTLLELKRDGITINQEMIDKSINMLKSVTNATTDYLGEYSEFHRLYAGYILAEHHQLSSSSANMLYEKGFYKKHFLSSYYMSAILKMQGKTEKANELYASVAHTLDSYQKQRYGNRSGNFESNNRDMFLHFIIKTLYFKKDANDLTIIQKSFDELHSTQERAIALKAISLYLGKPTDSKLDVAVKLNGKTENYNRPVTKVIKQIESNEITITPKSGAMSYNIELIKHLPKALKNSLSTTKEISVKREFVNEQNQTVNLNSLKLGDKIYSKVTIANYDKINSVVVNQRIPACLSIVNNKIQEETPNEKFENINIDQEYREIRDDRVLHFINLKRKEKLDSATKKQVLVRNQGTIFTPLLVTTTGVCKIPAVIVESMYDSRIGDYAKEIDEIVVER